MTAIRVVCRKCGREVNSAEVDSRMHCALCVGLAACSQLLRRYELLWGKRERYRKSGGPHQDVEKALGRQALRISERLHGHIGNPQLAAEVLNKALEHARQRAVGAQRIAVGKTLLVKP